MSVARPRSAWTTFKPNFTTGPKKVKTVYIHHTAIPGGGGVISEDAEEARMRAIESVHINERGWVAIGYSKVVFGSGRAFDGRGWGNKQGGNYDGGTNESTYSISFDGDFSVQTPTDAAWATAAALISEGVTEGWIDPGYAIKGHREEVVPRGVPGKEGCAGMTVVQCTGKDCPGKGVYTHFDRLTGGGEDLANVTDEQLAELLAGAKRTEDLEKGVQAFLDGKTSGGKAPLSKYAYRVMKDHSAAPEGTSATAEPEA